jgi:hypothetical protein
MIRMKRKGHLTNLTMIPGQLVMSVKGIISRGYGRQSGMQHSADRILNEILLCMPLRPGYYIVVHRDREVVVKG